jgi:uncharacterized membrane protein YdjX (TVP38/TMEM64 family)
MTQPAAETTDPSGQCAAAPPDRWTQFKIFFKRLGPAGPLAVVISTLPPLGGFILIGLLSRIAPWMRSHESQAMVIYVGGFAVLAAIAILPTYACAILGGWVFGFWIGFPASMVAFCLAAYLISALAAGNRVIQIIRERPRWEAVRMALLGCGFWRSLWIITLLRLPPTSPFAGANFVMGATRAPLGAYMLGTFIGMAPRTAVAVWAAASASSLDFKRPSQSWLYIVGIIVTIVVVAIIGNLANQAIKRVTDAHRPPEPDAQLPA